MTTFQLHHQILVTIERQTTRQGDSNEPDFDEVVSFHCEVLMAILQLHHQIRPCSIIGPWFPLKGKLLFKTIQTSPNSVRFCRFIVKYLWPPSSSIIRPWLSLKDKLLVKTIHTSPNSMWLCGFIAKFLWSLSSSIISSDPGNHLRTKYSSRRIKRAETRWGCVVSLQSSYDHIPAPSPDPS
ncbi:unnamed protein product [Euphydryas editha]|uniref:Uncharacterized protein n=1 Tax=Euphydryas editha TaxID=104508 RepID=A0AAU9U2C0_EUPED|nr:unnamed protein product [Euphydryas editha]